MRGVRVVRGWGRVRVRVRVRVRLGIGLGIGLGACAIASGELGPSVQPRPALTMFTLSTVRVRASK